jgi:hypothetical protein
MVGGAVTMLARNATRRALHDKNGALRLPRAARRSNGVASLLIMAAASGALLALVDVVQEHRRYLTDAT